MKRKALGRGLSALLPDLGISQDIQLDDGQDAAQEISPNVPDENSKDSHLIREIFDISVDFIEANRSQPRAVFDDAKLQELAESIRTHGILQPLLVRPHPELSRMFQLIAGERRLRAAKLIGLEFVPCIILRSDEAQTFEIALIENIQRANLSPIEEAKAYIYLIERFSLTQEEVSARVGKSRETIANTIRLINLPGAVLYQLQDGLLTAGHAKALLALRSGEEMEAFANRIINQGLTVRETEKEIREKISPSAKKEIPKNPVEKDLFVLDLERILEETFKTKVRIQMHGKNKGSINVDFFDLDQLDGILQKWNVKL